MTTIINVANQKGGVGKTTTAVTLGHGLSLAGRRVLIVDLDPQGHVAFALGMKKTNGLSRLLVESEPLHKVAEKPSEPGYYRKRQDRGIGRSICHDLELPGTCNQESIEGVDLRRDYS